MDKRIIILILLLAYCFFGYTQNDSLTVNEEVIIPENPISKEVKKFRFGLLLRPNVSWMKTETNSFSSNGNIIGFSYGLITDFKITDNYFFSTGVNITSTGGKINQPTLFSDAGTLLPATDEMEYKLRRIDLPITLKLRTNEIGWLVYFARVGLSTGFEYKSKANITKRVNNTEILQTENDVSVANDISLLSVSMELSGGIEYNISGNTYLFTGITFNNNFSNVFNFKAFETDNNNEVIVNSTTNTPSIGSKAKGFVNYLGLDFGIYF